MANDVNIKYVLKPSGYDIILNDTKILEQRLFWPVQDDEWLIDSAKKDIDRLLINNGHQPKYSDHNNTDYPFIYVANPYQRMDRMQAIGPAPVPGPTEFDYNANNTDFNQYSNIDSPGLFMFIKKDGSGQYKSVLTELNGVEDTYKLTIEMDWSLNTAFTGDEVGKLFVQVNGERVQTIDVGTLTGTSGKITKTYTSNHFDNFSLQMGYGGIANGTKLTLTNRKVTFEKQSSFGSY